jgi:RNA polymerase sigma factor (sigma-70 family)
MQPDFVKASAGELVTSARDGSQHAWNELVERFTPLLWGVARRSRLNQTDAADVVQATWLKLVEHLDRIREPNGIPAWLVTTCQREASRMRRANAQCSPQDPIALYSQLIEPVQDSTSDPAEAVLHEDTMAIVRSAVRELPTHQRQLLVVLTEGGGPSYAEVATALRMPVGSIGPTRQRALRRLRSNPRLQALL